MQCCNCGNMGNIHVRQDYAKNRVFLIPMGTNYGNVFTFCSVCEKNQYLKKGFFDGKEATLKAIELLEGGKEFTKQWVNTLSPKDRDLALRRLNKLEAYSLVKFISA